jgi:hypothetical protein
MKKDGKDDGWERTLYFFVNAVGETIFTDVVQRERETRGTFPASRVYFPNIAKILYSYN